MYQFVFFSNKQKAFSVWALKHLPLKINESKSGLLEDPFTKQNIAGVFYIDSNEYVARFIRFGLLLLKDSTAKENESKCIRYGLIKKLC